MLYSARSKEFKTKDGRKKAYENVKKNNIDAIVVIGGDGSFTGSLIFEKEFNIPIIGIPGTIDNDLFGTSHTLGYDTALNTVMEAIDKIRDTAISHDRLFFVEVMGRDAGHIALNSGIAIGAQEILIPESKIGLDELIISLKKSKKAGKTSSIVVVAEGDKTGKNVFELSKRVEDKFPDYEIKVSVLGHMQRGGSPTCFDRVLGTRMGVKAVETLIKGESSSATCKEYLLPLTIISLSIGSEVRYGINSIKYSAGCCPSASIFINKLFSSCSAFLNPVKVAAPTPKLFLWCSKIILSKFSISL